MADIEWGEGDVRDAMSYFDATPESLAPGSPGIRGERHGPPIRVYAYWDGGGCGVHVGPPDGAIRREFLDPIEAIQYAIALARGEAP